VVPFPDRSCGFRRRAIPPIARTMPPVHARIESWIPSAVSHVRSLQTDTTRASRLIRRRAQAPLLWRASGHRPLSSGAAPPYQDHILHTCRRLTSGPQRTPALLYPSVFPRARRLTSARFLACLGEKNRVCVDVVLDVCITRATSRPDQTRPCSCEIRIERAPSPLTSPVPTHSPCYWLPRCPGRPPITPLLPLRKHARLPPPFDSPPSLSAQVSSLGDPPRSPAGSEPSS